MFRRAVDISLVEPIHGPEQRRQEIPIADDAGVIRRIDPFIDRQRAADEGLGFVQAAGVPEHQREVHEIPGHGRVIRAKALLVDAEALRAAQRAGDVLEANAVLMDAYNTDVRPLLAAVREEAGLEPDPVGGYLRSGYAEKIVAERTGGAAAGWGA